MQALDWNDMATSAATIGIGPSAVKSIGRNALPPGALTRAIHIYGGDFFARQRPRSEWDHETLVERPWDLEHTRLVFAEAEARSRAASPAGGGGATPLTERSTR
jgi:hypothetical protein